MLIEVTQINDVSTEINIMTHILCGDIMYQRITSPIIS